MLSLRNVLAAGALAAATLASSGAGAQYYYAPSAEPPPRGFNRMIVTNAPVPPDLGRSYPYVSDGQSGAVQPSYAPRNRASHRTSKSNFSPKKKAAQAALIEELKKRPRIKKVTVEDTTASLPPPVAAAPSRNRRVGLDNGGERVIRAEAEVRIIGNDQMSIRLFRKGQGPRASAE